ncbi:prenylated flavin chaperone LpdD [Saccharibacillus alkalitolerans]|uniref:Prenylated flavin chaperone LpdD-like domain-containing protein n=1 Tax=Saccharibacillus alkalitolerans TaxID=2705290 RepID=A0ABX0F941_9BACL|nr:hypothetical protein [Saccharibacillus alkalitolerans]NGZ74532.1 hypothetical protein [Saccharibacillus alkalitolerans]
MKYVYNPSDIRVERRDVGRDTLLIVTGGAAHIGASSTAYAEDGGLRAGTSAVPGHKEHLLSEPAALHAARVLKRTVTVVMGIHYDGLSRAQIEELSEIVNRKIEEAIRET